MCSAEYQRGQAANHFPLFPDRNGKHFGSILNFLRDGQIPLPDTRRELMELQAEAKYFCIKAQAAACEASLSKTGGGGGSWGGDQRQQHGGGEASDQQTR